MVVTVVWLVGSAVIILTVDCRNDQGFADDAQSLLPFRQPCSKEHKCDGAKGDAQLVGDIRMICLFRIKPGTIAQVSRASR